MAGCFFSFQLRLFLAWAALGTWLENIVSANQGKKINQFPNERVSIQRLTLSFRCLNRTNTIKTADSLWRGALTVKLNELQPVREVASNPVQSHATYIIVFEFEAEYYDRRCQRPQKDQGKRQRHVHCDQEQIGRFFHIGQSMLTKLGTSLIRESDFPFHWAIEE